MPSHRPTAVLVITTLPEGDAIRARVLATLDVEHGEEQGVIVRSLVELQDVVTAWWSQCWESDDSPDTG